MDKGAGGAVEVERGGSIVRRWMDSMRRADRMVAGEREALEDQLVSREKHAVRHSLDNLAGFTYVAEAVKDGLLSLHGGWVDIAQGKLYTLDPGVDRFVEARAPD